jgi:hypothetical protein
MHAWDNSEIHTEYWFKNFKERDPLGDLSVDGKTI